MGLIWMSNFWIVYVLKCDLGRSWANISGSSVGWVENTRMSTQPICYLRNKNSINSMAGRKVGPWVQFFWLGIWKCYSLWVWKVNKQTLTHIRDITPGPTGASVVAPKFSDTLTLFHQRGWADSAPPLQRLHQKFPHGYISAHKLSFRLSTQLCNP